MTVGELIALRQACELTQSAMASAMGLGLRAYQDVEAQDDTARIHRRHRLLAERAGLEVAVNQRNIALAPPRVRRLSLALARLIEHGDTMVDGEAV